MTSYNPLPEIKVVPLTSSSTKPGSPQLRRGRPIEIQGAPADIRWVKVQEFLNGGNLAPNTRKVYQRELKRFLSWTDELLWGEIKSPYISQYKAYLMEDVRKDLEQALSKSSINSAIALLQNAINPKSKCGSYAANNATGMRKLVEQACEQLGAPD